MTWVPLHTHTHYSLSEVGKLLSALSKPEQVADRCVELDYGVCGLTDHGSVGGVPGFIKACEKKGVKPIAGSDLWIGGGDEVRPTRLSVFATDANGWKDLMRASSSSYRPGNAGRRPMLTLDALASFGSGRWVVTSGRLGSTVGDALFADPVAAMGAATYEEARGYAHTSDWEGRLTDVILAHLERFGKGNFYLEILRVTGYPANEILAKALRRLGPKLGVPLLAVSDPYYCRPDDAADHRVLVCNATGSTMSTAHRRVGPDLGVFFRSNRFHVPSVEEMKGVHESGELASSLEIASRCEPFKIGEKPLLPSFPCPDGLSPDEYLRKLCLEGWRRLVEPVVKDNPELKKVYADRARSELEVFREAGLSSYFLIVRDYIEYVNKVLNSRTGCGRGSSAGCLVAYLIGVTRRADPVKYGLIFERFYNAGRNSPGRISLPDIDTDFSVSDREPVINYVRKKYGDDRVCQMATFSRMQGRSALKDVLRAHERCSFEDMNLVTDAIPDEAEIADELQEMEQASIIRWALENRADKLRDWVELDKDGNLSGTLAFDFGQAMRLEGTKRNLSKHASGLVICSDPLEDVVPMVWDKSTESMITGVDMRDAEAMGLPKFDILGLNTIGKVMTAERLIRGEHVG